MKPVTAEGEVRLTLAELSRCSGVSAEKLLVLIGEGVVNPRGRTQPEWRFADSDLDRLMRALRLERDLGLNPAGAALAIDLIDEIQRLRRRMRVLESLMFQD